MITALWMLTGTACAVVMMAASRAAIGHAVALSEKLRISPFIVGITLVALGTDMPEIVNSIVSSHFGHGDINVGDSIGSVFAQGTLILGLFPFVAGGTLPVKRVEIFLLSGLTALLLVFGMRLVGDGMLSRLDSAALVLAWVLSIWTAWRLRVVTFEHHAPAAGADGSTLVHVAKLMALLAIVGGGAAGLVHAVAAVSLSFGVPEYLVSFFGAALGTSMPELVVDLTAMRRGQREIALGGILGACLMDASLSLGIGPMLFPTAVSATMAHNGASLALAATLATTLLLGSRGKHDRWSGAALIALYLSGYLLILARA